MKSVYLDASAWCKLLNAAEDHYLDMKGFVSRCQEDEVRMFSNEILYLEVRNMAVRMGVDLFLVEESFRVLHIVRNSEQLLKAAGSRILPIAPSQNQRHLKALDKLHLETAIQLEVDGLVVYDKQFAKAAKSLGNIQVLQPGAV